VCPLSCHNVPRTRWSPLFPYTTLFRSRLDHLPPAARLRDPLDGLVRRQPARQHAHPDAAPVEPSRRTVRLAVQPGRPLRELGGRSEEHTSELQSSFDLVCRLLLEKKKHHQTTCPSPLTISPTWISVMFYPTSTFSPTISCSSIFLSCIVHLALVFHALLCISLLHV